MGYVEGTTSIQVYEGDRDWVNNLAARLTKAGPGRFGQREAVRWLIDRHQKQEQLIIDAEKERAAVTAELDGAVARLGYLAREGSPQ